MPDDFYATPKRHSLVKAKVVSTYLAAWANVLLQHRKGAGGPVVARYVDLFAGQGIYDDGTPSTPILSIEALAKTRLSCDNVRVYLNDADVGVATALRQAVAESAATRSMRHKPAITCEPATLDLIERIGSEGHVPTFWFADQFGYRSVSREMVGAMTADWGSECVVFVNYNASHRQLGQREHGQPALEGVVGSAAAERLRRRFGEEHGPQKERAFAVEFARVFAALLERRVLPFRLAWASDRRPDVPFYLLFITKHALGLQIMVETIASATRGAGPTLLEWADGSTALDEAVQLRLFDWDERVGTIAESLAHLFANTEVTMEAAALAHLDHMVQRTQYNHVSTKQQLREAVLYLEERGGVQVIRPPRGRRGTVADGARLIFRSE